MQEQELSVDSFTHNKNQAKIAKEEAELAALLKGDASTENDEEQVEEAKSDSEGSETAEVQDEGNPKQEKAAEEKQASGSDNSDEGELSAEEKTFKQRYGEIRKHMADKEKDWKSRIEKLEAQLEKAAGKEFTLPKTKEDVESWAKKYPDVAAIVEAIAEDKAQKQTLDLDERLKEVEAMRLDARKQKAEAELLSLHPDFAEIRADEAFHEWAGNLPKAMQNALYDDEYDAKSVARVIDLYKADNGISSKPHKSGDKSAASSVKARSSAKPEENESASFLRESQIAKMTAREYEKRMDEIQEAMRSGKFIYDLSNK
tara:strand:- start:993 stop:1940 length:948 start_codon:yes stop_codon:yes gene_type:complete